MPTVSKERRGETIYISEFEYANKTKQNYLLWDMFSDDPSIDSILTWHEHFFEQTKHEFLSFISAISEFKVAQDTLCEHLRLPDGFSVWWISRIFERHPNFYGPVLFRIFKLRALEHYLDAAQPSAVTIHTCPDDAADIAALCRAKGIPCEIGQPFRSTRQPWGAKIRGAVSKFIVFAALKHAWLLIHWWCYERRFFSRKPTVHRKAGILLGTWFPNLDFGAAQRGHFLSRYWEGAHEVLKETAKPVHWLLIHADPPENISKNVALRDSLVAQANPSCDMVFWQEAVSPAGALKAFLQWCYTAYKVRKLDPFIQKAFDWPNSKLDLFPLLRPLWHDSTQGEYLLRQLLMLEGIRTYSKKIGTQEMVLTSSELQFWERILFREQRLSGCKKISAALHSCIPTSDFRFFFPQNIWNNNEFREQMPDTFYCNGPASFAVMEHAGFPKERLGLLEAVRFMELAQLQPFPRAEPKQLLVVTSYFEKETSQLLHSLADAMHSARFPIFDQVIIKAHPYLPVDKWLGQYFISPPVIVYEKIESYITEGTIMLTAAGTSVTLLALYANIPVVIKSPQNDFDMSPSGALAGVQYVRTVEELLVALENPTYANLKYDYFCLDARLKRWRSIFI